MKKQIITICGGLGSGKSSTAKEVARILGFKHFSSGDFFREVGLELGLSINEINKRGTSDIGWSYHLIILNSLEKTVQVKPYKRGSIKQAIADYAKIEAEAIKNGGKIEAVLVSAGPLSALRQAYPNFFLDIRDFVTRVEFVIAGSKK